MRLIATIVWNSIRHVCAHSAAVVCWKLSFAQYIFDNPFLSSVQRYTYTQKWSTIPFELTPDTTYEQYVYTNESLEVEVYNLLPPEFPDVRIWFRYHHPVFEQKFHRDCPGAGAWHVEIYHSFSNVFAAIDSLASEEETYCVIVAVVVFFSQHMSRSFTCKQLNMTNC